MHFPNCFANYHHSDHCAVASNTRGPRFESSHRQNLYQTFVYLFTISCIEKTKINEKRGRVWPTLKKKKLQLLCSKDYARFLLGLEIEPRYGIELT